MGCRFAFGRNRKTYRFAQKASRPQPRLETLEDRLTPAVPTVTTPVFTSLAPTSAVLGGNVFNNGGLATSARGIVYSLTSVNPNPTLGGTGVKNVVAPPYADMGAFQLTVGPLTATSGYSFRAYATNPDGTGYSPAATFTAPIGIPMPSNTVNPKDSTDYAVLNQVLFFQPVPGQTLPGTDKPVPQIPVKQVTITNNMPTTVYPFMRDAASTVDPLASADSLPPAQKVFQGLYDPIDQLFEEYRGYIGYSLNGQNYLGLPPGMTITVSVPLVFWDGSRLEIGVDGTYLVNNTTVGASVLSPNPYQYYAANPDGSQTARVAVKAIDSSGGPVGNDGKTASGVVMWYRQGLNNQTDRSIKPPEQAKGPINDAPAQLAEWTIRDPVLSAINGNIDTLNPHNGETHANINYDVSYVDSMALPVAMEALDVPVAVQTVPPLDPRNPNPGPRLPYGWIGAAQSPTQLQTQIAAFTSPGASNGLGSYFGGQGWPTYNLPASAFPAGQPPIKIPSGQDAVQDTPLADKRSSYDILANLYMLTSGGTSAAEVVGGAGAFSDGQGNLYLIATPDQKPKLEQQLQRGMLVSTSAVGAPTVPAGTTVKTIGPNDTGFVYTTYMGQPVLQIGLSNTVGSTGTKDFVFKFVRNATDYATTAMVNLWYTWANYYVTHATSTPAPNVPGSSLTTDPEKQNNVIKLTSPVTGLVPGMLVTGSAGSGIAALRADGTGATTILSIDPDNMTIHLSQAVGVSQPGSTYSFTSPTMNSPALAGASQATMLPGFNPQNNQVAGVPNVLAFAQNAYQLLSLMSQIPSSGAAPISAQVLGSVIGGLITEASLNGDAFHNTEVAYRTMVKSLLRGVNDFNKQNDPTTWYPDPSTPKAGLTFNAYNLDPFVWFVHKQLGLSGYGFSLDDDTADVSGNFSTKLGIAIGGLNGLPNQYEWTNAAPFGPVTGTGTVVSAQQVKGLPPYTFFSAAPYNSLEQIPGANIQGVGVKPGTGLAAFGDGGLYTYSFLVGSQPPTPSDQITLAPGTNSTFTIRGNGRVNFGPNTFVLGPGVTQAIAPYMNPLVGLTIPSGSTLQLTTVVGSFTSYTQQIEESARPSIVPTSALNNSGRGPSIFVPNAPLPDLNTIVNGALTASLVNIADGWLSGTGIVNGNLSVTGPISGYDNGIVLKSVDGEPIDPSWNNPNNVIQATSGGFLAAGARGASPGVGTPGKLAVSGDLSMNNATFTVYATGAGNQGRDYSWVSVAGKANLGNTTLSLAFQSFTPQPGSTFTILTASKGVTGKFAQGNSITVNGLKFNITYNANSVVLTRVAGLNSPPPKSAVNQLYEDLLDREAEPAAVTYWNDQLASGTSRATVVQDIYDSAEHRGIQVNQYYQEFFQRTPTADERAVWVAALQAGASEIAVQATFLASPEYLQMHPDTASFVNAVFNNVLARAATSNDLAFWENVAASSAGPAGVALGVLESTEADTDSVRADYEQFLGREPDAAGLSAWLNVLVQHLVTPTQVELAILASDEFFGINS